MRIEALKYRTEEKIDIVIIVGLRDVYNNLEWIIEDVKYKTSRQRNYRFYSKKITDSYEYRKTDFEHRYDYMYQQFSEFVGEDKLKEAMFKAWEYIKPVL